MLARIVAIAGAALVVLGFFLPWLHGSAEFTARDFSGFDLARLVRNFEIARGGEQGQFRVSAVALYALPALAINGAVLAQFTRIRRAAGLALSVAGLYGIVLLASLLLLASVSWTDLEHVLGAPMPGYFATLLGVALLTEAGISILRPVRAGGPAAEVIVDNHN